MSASVRALAAAGAAVVLATTSVAGALAAQPPPPRSSATMLLAGVPAREPTQVVVFDRQTGTTTLVSHDQTGVPGSVGSSRPTISTDGSFIAFQSNAGLVPGDTDGATDVYLWDRAIGNVQLVSQRPGGGGSNGESRNPSISADASVVAFASTSTNITGDQGLGGGTQVFAWQRLTGAVTLVSVAQRGGAGDPGSGDPVASGDGRVIAFESTADDLVPGDTNDARDIFLRDVARGATIRASIGSTGRQAGAESRRPSISGDGGAVVFDSTAAVLAPNDTNGARDVFVRDLPPAVLAEPNPLDFGLVPLGVPATQSVTVTSYGWTPAAMQPSTISGTNAGDFAVAGDSCAGLLLQTGSTCTIAVIDIPLAEGARTATLEVLSNALDSPYLVELRGGVPGPELRLEPAVGPPGMVAVLHATNFPPGSVVIVRWDRGITQQIAPFTVGPDGTATIQVLIYHHDLLGPRQLLVTPGAGGQSFVVAPVPFLVVAPPLQPPGQSAISFLNPELQLIPIRR